MNLPTFEDNRANLYENLFAITSSATPYPASGFGQTPTFIPEDHFQSLELSYLWADDSPNYLWATEPLGKKHKENVVLETFALKMIQSMKDADPEFLKIADECFEDILL